MYRRQHVCHRHTQMLHFHWTSERQSIHLECQQLQQTQPKTPYELIPTEVIHRNGKLNGLSEFMAFIAILLNRDVDDEGNWDAFAIFRVLCY